MKTSMRTLGLIRIIGATVATAAAVITLAFAATLGEAARLPAIAWSPATNGTFDYGTVDVGDAESQTFALTNSGRSATGMLTIALDGGAEFSITEDACSGTALGPRKSCTVTVQYAPTTPGQTTAMLAANGIRPPASASITLTGTGASTGTQTFSYTGAAQTFTVPNGVTRITATVVGAAANVIGLGGFGEEVVATLPVTSGETLNIYVGGSVSISTSAGGFNGGGSGCVGCGGGGASDIREGGAALANRIIVAGGGGGFAATGGFAGGNAGFTTGSAGQDALGFPGSGGGGGTQSAGGSGGTISGGNNGSDGALGVGGDGAPRTGGGDAGGGGGGYYGGGGGAFAFEQGLGGGGGGGSSFVEDTATGVSHSQATRDECDTSNNGCITISW
jgi:hypothetical protein